jgi:NhaP-type Na+/H+ or K+/H+ antiporter
MHLCRHSDLGCLVGRIEWRLLKRLGAFILQSPSIDSLLILMGYVPLACWVSAN